MPPTADDLPSRVLATRRRIGARVRTLREDRGLSQETLAHSVGLDRRTVSYVELATHAASIDVLVLLADALGVPLADLVRDG
ncbi:helix-turn-helix domain-containing protein [Streptomyces youssoufiensis]